MSLILEKTLARSLILEKTLWHLFFFSNKKMDWNDTYSMLTDNTYKQLLTLSKNKYKETFPDKRSISIFEKTKVNLSVKHFIPLEKNHLRWISLVVNDCIELFKIADWTKTVNVSKDFTIFRIQSTEDAIPSYRGIQRIDVIITKEYIWLHKDDVLERSTFLPRSCYGVIVDFFVKVTKTGCVKTILGGKRTTAPFLMVDQLVQRIAKRWTALRLLFIGNKDSNSVLSCLPSDVFKLVYSYAAKQDEVPMTDVSKKRKNEQIENEQNKKK